MFDIKEALKNLPDSPGVYIMKDENGEIIYIGKAISLKNRVRQYFQNSKNQHPKVRAMVYQIREFEYILTDNELEALVLEANLIKKHKPKYNILLKDDKNYPYIKVTLTEEYPRVLMVRKLEKDGAKYFGPFTDLRAVKDTLLLIKKLYKIRTCNRQLSFGTQVGRPCLNYHIGICLGPCKGDVTKEDYMKQIEDVIKLLSGKHDDVLKDLEEKMFKASENLEFERAAEIRDNINAIKKIQQKQKIISSALEDEDVIAFAKDDEGTCIQMFYIRGGKLLGTKNFYFKDIEENVDELISQFLVQYYSNEEYIPRDIILQSEVPEINIIEYYLSRQKGSKVKIKTPKKGDKKDIVEMAQRNAEAALTQIKAKIIKEKQKTIGALEELKEILGIENIPYRIEAYDISNISGVDMVGSMVVFENGAPKNKDYRRFKIKNLQGQNDYAALEEVLRRRFNRFVEEMNSDKPEHQKKFNILPDLILMDGGEGQVNIAKKVLEEFSLDIHVAGMVKDDKHRTRGLIFQGSEIMIYKDSNAFKLVAKVQDEVHRFAIEYHRKLRSKSVVKSSLDEIEGIGSKRKTALLKHFGSIENIKNANIEELSKVEGMNIKAAERVYNYFHQ
ncbi:UvrABC system protein C [Caloramator mitchellensis]|uniref:UvrABC system protein C n=1 Tax=Caloramator mitchellensis TaxID=908809 RepID=A0A0R3JU65_CALMK|nr:excinuclease ABC subunit UvrC [Caloramator mitchellensis]KRQ87107.1 UvrABC system protein C [Caloramator mitchellensis]